MFDDLTVYYSENVVSPFCEHVGATQNGRAGRSRDLRSALAVCSALFHFREHLPTPPSRTEVEKACPDYGLLADVVNTSKHRQAKHATPHGPALLSDATKLFEEIVIVECADDLGTFSYSIKTTVVELKDRSKRDLLEASTNVINFWERYLASRGLQPAARHFVYSDPIRPRTRTECEGTRLDFEVVQGERFRQRFHLARFDKDGLPMQVDLRQSQVTFRVFKPPRFTIDLALESDGGGEVTTIELSDEESATFEMLTSDADRRAYLQKLPSVLAAVGRISRAEQDGAKSKG